MVSKLIPATLLAGAVFASEHSETPKDALSANEQHIAAISACAAAGDMDALNRALHAGLDAGLTVSEIKEILTQAYAYCGFPRSLNALDALMKTVHERAAAGKKDAPGEIPSARPAGSALAYGTENQTKLIGAPVKGELYEFAPAIDEYLKSHLFGDIFARDNVSWKTRELATIAFLAAMEGTEKQLEAHIQIGMRNGLTQGQVNGILAISRGLKQADAFPLGEPADSKVFTGNAWVSMLLQNGAGYDAAAYNVTFAPGTRNNWHSHTHGQILFCTVGIGFYQEKGKPARKLHPGDVVEIPPHVMHWHGAAPNSAFAHLGLTPKAGENKTTWGGPVTDQEYSEATAQ